ncbi:hypothetical protein QUB33_10165 [Microcoleus sp. B3-A4]
MPLVKVARQLIFYIQRYKADLFYRSSHCDDLTQFKEALRIGAI